MRHSDHRLAGESPGTTHTLRALAFSGSPGRKAYLQAGLHADELPGMLVLQHLIPLLTQAEAEGRLVGDITVVPMANPIGFAQWAWQRPVGRHELGSLQNFNRGFPDLAVEIAEALESQLTIDGPTNRVLIRAAMKNAATRLATCATTDLAELRARLLSWSCDADLVLDLHCDHRATLHFYANTAQPEITALLGRSMGAELALVQDISGGNAFDEANSAPWIALRQRFGTRFPVPDGCYAATLEYRGQFDVADSTAAADAMHLMTFLAASGFVQDWPHLPAHSAPSQLPLGAAAEVFAPQGGLVTWQCALGAKIAKGALLALVRDPLTGEASPVTAPCSGIFFRHELWPSCRRGQSLAHVAGEIVLRHGDLLSD